MLAEAIIAINRLIAAGPKRDFAFFAAFGADGLIHFLVFPAAADFAALLKAGLTINRPVAGRFERDFASFPAIAADGLVLLRAPVVLIIILHNFFWVRGLIRYFKKCFS